MSLDQWARYWTKARMLYEEAPAEPRLRVPLLTEAASAYEEAKRSIEQLGGASLLSGTAHVALGGLYTELAEAKYRLDDTGGTINYLRKAVNEFSQVTARPLAETAKRGKEDANILGKKWFRGDWERL